MNKITGILLLLIYICIVTALLNDVFVDSTNLGNVVRRTALFGIIGIGVSFVIITGGIDLSIGSLIGLVGCVLAMMLEVNYEPVGQANLRELRAASASLEYEAPQKLLEPGDQVAIYDGKASNQGVYEVAEAGPASSSATSGDAAPYRVQLTSPPPGDDRQGRVMQVFPVLDFKAEAAELRVDCADAEIQPGDRLVYFGPNFQRTYELRVARAEFTDGLWRVGVEATLDELSASGHVGLIKREAWPVSYALGAIVVLTLAIGFFHGFLITKIRLQPFVVTLCGLLMYRGIARALTDDQSVGFGTEYENSLSMLAKGTPASVATLMCVGGIVVMLFLLWKWLLTGQREQLGANASRSGLLFGAAFGGLVALVGSARFWSGWQVDPSLAERPPLELLGFSIPYWPYTVAPESAAFPAELMQWLGWLALPAALFFVGRAVWQRPREMVIPLVVFAVAAGLFGWALQVRNWPDEQFGSLAGWARTVQIVVVFFSSGVFFAALAWVGRRGLQDRSPAIRWAAWSTVGFGILGLAGQTELPATMVPAPFLIFLVVAGLSSLFMTQTIYGRYLMALGRNEQAARFSGIKTDKMVMLAYVICAACAGLGGLLFALDVNSIQPAQHGSFYELYAIAAAVLGGCSLRGGEGRVLGVMIGAALMQFLSNSIFLIGIPDQLEFAIIGVVILIGVIADELVRRMSLRKQAQAREAA